MLVIDDVEKAVRDDDAVAGAETSIDAHIPRVVEFLLHEHERIGAPLSGFGHLLHHEGGVALGAVLHLLAVVGQVLGWVPHPAAQRLFHLVGAEFVAVSPFLRVLAGLVLILLTKPGRRRAVQPPVACGGRQ